MWVAGIDASTTKTGIAIFNDGELVAHTLIDLHKESDIFIRMSKMILSIDEYLSTFQLDKIIIEKSVLKSNADTLQKLSMLSGAIMHYAIQHEVSFENPLPSQWRKVVGLEQSRKIERKLLKIEAITAVEQEYSITVTDDEAEAILIARSAFNLSPINITAADAEDKIWD